MTWDRATWQDALAQYRAWNEAEFEEKVRNAGKCSLAERWQLTVLKVGHRREVYG